MALKQITAKDFKDAVSSLTNGYTCWRKLLGRTDAGTELVFVIGWSDAGYDEEDAKKNGYADGRYTICSKIACQSRYNGSQTDYDIDFEMPYDKETGDVWDTDTMVSNNESDWEADAATYNKDAQAIWDTYCVPDEDGFTALDALFESKKSSDAKKHTCSMQKKKESLSAKKSKKCEGLLDDLPYDAPVAIESLCAEIMSHTEEFTIEDAAVAEMCGKWYIRDYANGSTAAQNEDEFVDEILAGLSGSPLDGSPFGAAEAEEYARKIYNEVVA